MEEQFKPGHLASGGPFAHKQTIYSKEVMSKKSRQYWSLKKIKPVELNWKQKEK